MKTLILVRHAKSSWKYDVSDRERGLKTRGIEDAHNVVTEFLSTNEMPDTIFCSPAKRAQDTCKIF
jgi:phosphohistidine phosphatase